MTDGDDCEYVSVYSSVVLNELSNFNTVLIIMEIIKNILLETYFRKRS